MKESLAELFDAAFSAKARAYAPYSNHPVGVALRTSGGAVFGGCNVETAHYKGTCAEAGAIAAMVMAGEHEIVELVVVGPGKHLCTPCGDCRQRVREFAKPKTKIHVFDVQGTLMKSYTLEELLPDSISPEDVKSVA